MGRRPSGGSVVLQPTPNSSPIWDKRGFKKKGLDSKYLAKQIPGSGVGGGGGGGGACCVFFAIYFFFAGGGGVGAFRGTYNPNIANS